MTDLQGKKLLVVSASPQRAASLRDELARAGLSVTVTFTPPEALLALEQLPQDILLIDGRFGEPFPDAFPRVRLQSRGRPLQHILLINPPMGPALSHWLRVLSSHGVTPRTLRESSPYHAVDSLREALGRPARPRRSQEPPTPATPSAPKASSLHPANMPPQPEALHFMLGVWARRSTGLLEMPLMGHSAQMVKGEPASPADLPVLVQAMYVGGATFTPGAAAATGSAPILGAHLWEAGRRLGDGDYVLGRMSSLLVQRSAGRRAKDLPLPADLQRLLSASSGRASLLGLCAGANVAPSEIAAPLSALIRMGLFSLRPAPNAAQQEEPPSLVPELSPAPVEVPRAQQPRPSAQGGALFATHRFSAPLEPPRDEDPRLGDSAGTTLPPLGHHVAPPSAPRREPKPPRPRAARPPAPQEERPARSVEPRRPKAPTRSAPAKPQRPLAERMRSKPARSQAPRERRSRGRRSSPEAAAVLLKRLRREWELIEIADDWTTLGIPADSTAELVERAADRLERRYAALAEGESDNPEIQTLARRILERVRAAAGAVRTGEQRDPGQAQPEVAFREGVRALERGSFSHAARWFQSARQSDPRNAIFNGYLGWAVYNDPSLPREQRRKKGFELLQLAEVTAEPVPELQYFLAKVESQEGDVRRARARLRRLLKSKPGYTAAKRALEGLPAEPPPE